MTNNEPNDFCRTDNLVFLAETDANGEAPFGIDVENLETHDTFCLFAFAEDEDGNIIPGVGGAEYVTVPVNDTVIMNLLFFTF